MFSLSPIPPITPTFPAARLAAPTVLPAPHPAAGHVAGARQSLLEAIGALNPVELMWLRPGHRPVQPDMRLAMEHAEAGIEAITAAIDVATPERSVLRSSLAHALQDARAGYARLTSESVLPDLARVSSELSSAVDWLDRASTAIDALRGNA